MTAAPPFAERGYADGIAASLRQSRAVALASGCDVQFTIDATGYQRVPARPRLPAHHCATAGAWSTPVQRGDGQTLIERQPAGVALAAEPGSSCSPSDGTVAGRRRGDRRRAATSSPSTPRAWCKGHERAMPHRRERGVTLIELVVAIVVIAVAGAALPGTLAYLNGTGNTSILQAQAQSIANAYLNEILGKNFVVRMASRRIARAFTTTSRLQRASTCRRAGRIRQRRRQLPCACQRRRPARSMAVPAADVRRVDVTVDLRQRLAGRRHRLSHEISLP